MRKKYTAIFTPAEEVVWVARCAEIPGANTEGETLAEARRNLKDAIRTLQAYRARQALSEAAPAAKMEEIGV
ncbi:MAG: type II toxin-antitoxin system HicB family antitoxin [Planctomycetota bacterium]